MNVESKSSKDNLVKFSDIMKDKNIDDYVKNEMRKSMMSTTGVPKGFHRPSASAVFNPRTEIDNRSPEDKLRTASSKLYKLGRSSTQLHLQERLASHKKEKMIEKIRVPCNRQYYDKLPIKPGFFFFDSLLRVARGRISDLKINIPESIYYKDKIFYLHTQETGHIECKTDVYGYKFLSIIEEFRAFNGKSQFERIAVIARTCGDELNDMEKYIMDWPQFNMKMSANEIIQFSLLQRYIHTPANRPAVTRFHYFAQNKDNKANFAYFINSTTAIVDKAYFDLQKCVVNTKDPENIEYFVKSGSAIRVYEQEAKKIVEYLNKGYNVRIEKIILDFITDTEGKIWFSGCKACEIDSATLQNSLPPVQEWWDSTNPPKIKKQEENQYLMNFVHCKLCRLYYTNNQLSHLVSVRMLMVFKVHSLGRGELPLDTSHLKVTSNDMLSQSVRICQFCYMLVTSEFELMEVEEALASALNIPKKEIDYEEDPKIKVQKHFLPKKLTQYRVLLFVHKLFDTKLNMKLKNLHIHVKFGEIVTSFRLKMKKSFENKEEVFVVDLLKVHYVFTSETRSLEKLVNSEILQFKLNNSERYVDKAIGMSKSQCLSDLPSDMSIGSALFSKKQILMFNSEDQVICNMAVYLGLSADKTVDSKSIKIGLNKVHDFYIPDFHFITVDPLPIEWLELFGKEVKLEESFANKIEESQFYQPTMSLAEMLRMEDITSPYKAIPKIYMEKKKEEPKNVVSPGISIYNVVTEYLNVGKVRHAKRKSWSGRSIKKSGRTSATSRATPYDLKPSKAEFYNEFMD